MTNGAINIPFDVLERFAATDCRYVPVRIPPPSNWPGHISFAIGWDPPLITYFAQVLDYSISHDDDCVIVWLGAMPPYYTDLGSLMQTMNRRIRVAVAPDSPHGDDARKLIRDQKAAEAW